MRGGEEKEEEQEEEYVRGKNFPLFSLFVEPYCLLQLVSSSAGLNLGEASRGFKARSRDSRQTLRRPPGDMAAVYRGSSPLPGADVL